jgi:hypothetical protein
MWDTWRSWSDVGDRQRPTAAVILQWTTSCKFQPFSGAAASFVCRAAALCCCLPLLVTRKKQQFFREQRWVSSRSSRHGSNFPH